MRQSSGSGLFSFRGGIAGLVLLCGASAFAGEDDGADAASEFEEIIRKGESRGQANAADADALRRVPDFDENFQFTIQRRPHKFPLDEFKVQSFVKLSDFLKLGYECFGRYLVSRGNNYAVKMNELRKAAEPAVAVIEIRNRKQPASRHFMTGAVINGGKHFLSAGHFEAPESCNFTVRLNDGRAVSAKLVAHRGRDKGDWAIFELTSTSNGVPAALPSLDVSMAAADAELLLLGYPSTRYVHDSRVIAGEKCNYRGRPFPTLAQKNTEMEGNWVLEGLAGSTPLPGSSGSPVLNVSSGKIVGIYVAQASKEDELESDIPNDVTIMQVVPVSALRAELEKLKIPVEGVIGRRPR